MSNPRDRRSTQRYDVVGTPVFLAWEVDSRHNIIYGTLKNISLSGASVTTDEAAPESGVIWIRLNHRDVSGWVAAKIVGVRRTGSIPLLRRTSYQVRITFTDSCPYEFFKAAIEGFASYCEIPDAMRHLASRWR